MGIPSVDAKALLLGASVGSADPDADWGIHVSMVPPEPVRAISIFDTGGTGEGPNPKWRLDYRTIQVLVRGGQNDYVAAYEKAQNVKDALLGVPAHVAASGDRWDGVTGIGDITHLARDENGFVMLSINFRIIIEPAATALTNREAL
jgi:hypothetical protein